MTYPFLLQMKNRKKTTTFEDFQEMFLQRTKLKRSSHLKQPNLCLKITIGFQILSYQR